MTHSFDLHVFRATHAIALDRSEVPASETQRVPQPEPPGHAHQNDDRVQDFPLRSLPGAMANAEPRINATNQITAMNASLHGTCKRHME